MKNKIQRFGKFLSVIFKQMILQLWRKHFVTNCLFCFVIMSVIGYTICNE